MAKVKKLEILFNQKAGNGQSNTTCKKIQAFLDRKQINYQIHKTMADGDGIRIARELADGLSNDQMILVIGGDGTLNQALNGVKISQYPQTPIAYIPSGSGNDFSRGVKIKREDPTILLQRILAMSQPVEIDVAKATDLKTDRIKYFVNNIGMGFDASAVYYTNHSKRKNVLNSLKLGTLAYVSSLVKVIRLQKGFDIDVLINGKTKHFDNAYIVTATNHPYFGGGIAIDPKADPFDHKLDLVVVNKITGTTFVKLFVKLLTDGSHLDDQNVWHIQQPTFTIYDHQPEQGQMDGEELGEHRFEYKFESDSHLFWLPVTGN
ncbi:diacylglycerol/lipid kinase family protein [Companilactobacillus furfuricola]|uniref:diacylglycerol/lipid kinase family protein n=1 Tax=Companilactobacillus furfuricola TaxID=1462575 RepID=UPI000F7B1606|nr:YegS/Rv2252/BmrU family lipid kinase [Companilactobacillus furfuricola]